MFGGVRQSLRFSSVVRRGLRRNESLKSVAPVNNPSECRDDSPQVLPWGSPPRPDFASIRKSTALSSPQMDSLIREHLPQDSVEVCKERSKVNKALHRFMKQKKYGELEKKLEELRSGTLPLDEVTFVAIIFGHLQLKDGLPHAESVASEMQAVDFIHPSLKSMVSSFVSSLKTLDQFDAYPNKTALLKAYLPFMEIATDIRKLRILGFRVAMSERVKAGEIVLPSASESIDEDVLDDIEDEIDHRTLY